MELCVSWVSVGIWKMLIVMIEVIMFGFIIVVSMIVESMVGKVKVKLEKCMMIFFV